MTDRKQSNAASLTSILLLLGLAVTGVWVWKRIPPGTQSGALFRLKGKGIADLRGYGRGDHVVRVMVETPRKLTKRQQELLEEFAKSSGQEVHPMSRGFFDKVKEMFG